MDFLPIMHAYFAGEKLEAALFIAPVGLLFLALAFGAWRSESGGFMWGTVIPAALIGLILLGTGIGVATRTAGQVETIERSYAEDPSGLAQVELPRMHQVMQLFSRTLPTFAVLVVLGLLLRYGVRSGWAAGLGAVLVAGGGVGMLIDGFAERRALPYIAALEALTGSSGGDALEPQ